MMILKCMKDDLVDLTKQYSYSIIKVDNNDNNPMVLVFNDKKRWAWYELDAFTPLGEEKDYDAYR